MTGVHPGLCSVTFRALSPEQVIDLAVVNGIRAIEWGGDVHLPPGGDAAGIAARSEAAGLARPSYGSYLRAGRDEADGVARALDTAVALGADNIRVWCPWSVGPSSDAGARSQVAAGVGCIAAGAAERGLTVSLEFHGHTLTETAASTNRLLAEVDAPNVYTYWQPAVGAGVDTLLDELDAVVDRLSHLHVFSWAHDGERLALGGRADLWPSALATARRSGRWLRDRYALIEFVAGDDPDQFARDAATLRSWLADDQGAPR